MGVTYLPGAPQYGQGGGQENLVQLAMAIKSFKMQEKQQKKQDAQAKLEILMKNPQMLLMTDPKDLEKSFKDAYDIKFNAEVPPNPQDATQVAPPKTSDATGDKPAANVNPNQLASLASATQGNKSGAAAGAPASPGAANKAPGAGVNPSLMSPQDLQHMAGQAHQNFTQKFGAVAPLYAGAMTQLDQENLKAQTIAEIEYLKQDAGKGNLQSMGRLFLLSGKQLTDADMRGMIISSNMDPKVISQAMDFALGNETDADKAKRFDSTLKTLSGNPDFMGKLQNPTDITAFARSVVYGGKLPEGIAVKPHTLTELNAEADYEKYLINDVGLPYDIAHLIGRSRTEGVDAPLSLPGGLHTLAGDVSFGDKFQTLSQRKVGATEKQADAAMIAAEAARDKVRQDGLKIASELSLHQRDVLNDRLRTMIEADKAKHSFPPEVRDALLAELGREVGLSAERVQSWYQHVTGGYTQKYTPVPDTELAGQAAGGKGPIATKPKERSLKQKGITPSGSDVPNPLLYLQYLMTGKTPESQEPR